MVKQRTTIYGSETVFPPPSSSLIVRSTDRLCLQTQPLPAPSTVNVLSYGLFFNSDLSEVFRSVPQKVRKRFIIRYIRISLCCGPFKFLLIKVPRLFSVFFSCFLYPLYFLFTVLPVKFGLG